jgi:hypothetical protein
VTVSNGKENNEVLGLSKFLVALLFDYEFPSIKDCVRPGRLFAILLQWRSRPGQNPRLLLVDLLL